MVTGVVTSPFKVGEDYGERDSEQPSAEESERQIRFRYAGKRFVHFHSL